MLKNKIQTGEYIEGDLIPTEIELITQFKVSRVTVRKAIELLSNEGFVITRQGKGTEVLDPKTIQRLNYVTSFTETLIDKGYTTSSKNVHVDYVNPPARVASELKIDPNTEVLRIYRIRLANDKPIAIMINYLPKELVPEIEKKIGMFESLYQLLESEYNINIDSAIETVGARMAGFTEAELLEIREGSCLISSRRVSFCQSKPIEVVVSSILADKYEYVVYLKDRPV